MAKVQIVLQFGDKRFSNSFDLNTTLWEVLRCFEENNILLLTSICERGDDSVLFWYEPAVLFINKYYSGIRVLSTTTLKSMGISKSQRVSLFFSSKLTNIPFDSVKREIDEADFLFDIQKAEKPVLLPESNDDFQWSGPGRKLNSDSNLDTRKDSRPLTSAPRKMSKEVGDDAKYFKSFMIRDGMVQDTGEFAPSISSSSSSSSFSSSSSSTRPTLKQPLVNAEYQRLLTLAYAEDHDAHIIFPDTPESNVSTLYNVKANANVTSIRVVFSNGCILEGLFHRNNTLADLHAFVRQHLQDPMGELYLVSCFPPPRRYDSSASTTLYAAGLYPVSRVVAQPYQAALALTAKQIRQQADALAQAQERAAVRMGKEVQQSRMEAEEMMQKKKNLLIVLFVVILVGVVFYFMMT